MKKFNLIWIIAIFLITLPLSFATLGTGGTTFTSGNQQIHVFKSNGTFEITEGGNASILVVGGGGGGGNAVGAGGGAGGLNFTASITLTTGIYSISIGTGGRGGVAGNGDTRQFGQDGQESRINLSTQFVWGKGGGGGGYNGGNGKDGGSGGGGGYSFNGGAGTTGQGNAGGNGGAGAPNYGGGGGGGAGAVGSAGSTTNGGNGGTGFTIAINGTSTCYAGGGGGGTLDGASLGTATCGGAGAGLSQSATNYTGGGGGGSVANNNNQSGDGGYGVIIISYEAAAPDTTPPQFTLINLTSEGGLGQIIFNLDGVDFRTTPPFKKTNDTTPTFRLNTSESSTCGITANKTSSYAQCSTTGASLHTCTVAVDHPIGTWNFSTNCTDSSGNKNQTQFLVNITDNTKPNIYFNDSGHYFVYLVNNTGYIVLNATDNYDILNLSLDRNGTNLYSNNDYQNGTDVAIQFSLSSGTYNFSALATDSSHNQNRTDYTITISQQCDFVHLSFDGFNDSSKYEFGSKLNITANSSDVCNVCISLDAPGYGDNYSCSLKETSFIYNITILRQSNSTNGANVSVSSGSGINISLDNRTEIIVASLNISAEGKSNINITYVDSILRLYGVVESNNLILREFVSNSLKVSSVNISYVQRSSQFISVNVSSNPRNLSFQLRGYELDLLNEFAHNNSFENGINMNNTLSSNVSTPIIVDSFQNDNSLISITGQSPSLVYDGQELELFFDTGLPGFAKLEYKTLDFRNTSKITFEGDMITGSGSGDAGFRIYATDGTSRVVLLQHDTTAPDNVPLIITFTSSDNGQTVSTSCNVTCGARSGVSLSSLDINNRFEMEFSGAGGSRTAQWNMDEINVSGIGLKYSSNGTYYSDGNYTSKLLTRTTNNISVATLSWTELKPNNTSVYAYVSNTCNSSNPTFESVTNGGSHVFTSIGNTPCYRFSVNSSVNITTPRIIDVDFNIIKSSPSNISIDYNDDGTTEFNFGGILNSSNSPINFSILPSSGNRIIKISSNPGIIEVSNFIVNSTLNPITLSNLSFENCLLCSINFSFGGGGLISVKGIKLDFLGSKNYTVKATANSSLNVVSNTKTLIVKYSNFNFTFPGGIFYYNIFAKSKTQYNITPLGQSNSTSIYNISSLAYDDKMNLYLKTNETLNSCMNITFSNSSLKSQGIKLNTSYQMLCANISIDGMCNVWSYVDLSNCSSRFYLPWFHFATVCSNCTVTSLTNFSDFNLLVS